MQERTACQTRQKMVKYVAMTRERFFKIIDREIGLEDRERIEWAYALAKNFHRDQIRDEGVRYFEHCRKVVLLLVKYGPTNPDELIVALLHDIYEDQFVPRGMIRHLFGQNINEAIKVLSHEKPFYKSHGRIVKTSQDLKKYFNSIRHASLLIKRVKLADRLNNMETLQFCTKEKQLRKINETREYILPIAEETDKRFHMTVKKLCDKTEKSLKSK